MRVLTTALVLVVGGFVAASCDDGLTVYSLLGQTYDEANDCLAVEAVIDVVEGTADTSCGEVSCLRSVETGSTFITRECAAPASLYEDHTDDGDAVCEAALAAYDRGATCD
ncbi:MAG: hypothetical protein U0271_17320 [Polyangiaceae bacterium]